MPENIGGLNYEINVTGNFEAKLAEFEKRANALQVKAATAGSAAGRKGGDVIARKQRALLDQEKVANAQILDSQTKITAQAVTQSKIRRANLSTTNQQLLAEQKILATQTKLAVAKKAVTTLAAREGISQRKAAEQLGVSAQRAKLLGINMVDAEHAARQFLFTFRRLVGILAIFTAARKIAQALGSAVKEMTRFNAELETAEIGIASIVASVGQIRDSQGELVTGAEAFTVAVTASRNIVQDLKKEAIGSIATFEALVKSYQVAIGPGLAAGLDLNQIKLVSKRLAEGALSLGVPLNQLSEEIRSLLQGTATARNTRIAVLFGGAKEANEAIRNAKEQGNLFEVLTDKFGGIEQGARAAAFSLNVLKSNLQDTVQVLLAEGGIEQFNQVKEATLALSDALLSVDDQGGFIFTPEALGLVQEVAGTLASVTKSFRDMTDTSSILATLRNLLGGVGDVLRAIAPVAFALFQGMLDGINTVLAPVRLLGVILRQVAKTLGLQKANKSLAQVVKFVTQVTVGLFLWKKTLLFINGLLGAQGMLGSLKIILAIVDFTAFKLKAQGVAIFSINGLTAIWSALMGNVAVKTALATGGITLLLGVLAAVVVKMGLIDKLTGSFNNELSSADKRALDLEHSISSAADATADGAKSAKEWADALKSAQKATKIAESIAGLSGETKQLVELLAAETAEYEKQSSAIQTTINLSKIRQRELQSEIDALNTANIKDFKIEGVKIDPGATTLLQSQFDALIQDVSGNVSINVVEGIAQDFENVEQSADRLFSEITKETTKIKKGEEDLVLLRNNSLAVLREQLKQYKAQNTLINEQQNVKLAEEAERISKAVNARANETVRELAATQAEATILAANVELETKRRGLALSALRDQIKAVDGVVGREAELVALQDRYAREVEVGAEARKAEAAEIAEMEQSLERITKLTSGSFADAFTVGLEDFVTQLPSIGEQIAETITDALSDLAGVVASTFKDAIDPRKDVDIKTAFGEFFLDLAGQFVENITSRIIASTIDFVTQATTQAAVQATTEAASAVTEGATDAATEAASTAAVTAAISAQTVALGVSTATQTTSLIAFWTASVVPLLTSIAGSTATTAVTASFSKGGFVKGFAKGGSIKGYASGGNIASIPRPASIPTSDTVPAWLTPGEFVVKRNSVAKYGTGFLNAINNGVLNPKTFSATGLALGGMAKGVQHFASGGGVRRSATSTTSGQQPQTVVLPVLPATENNMDQMIAGGRGSFNTNLNKADIIGDPNKSKIW